jgi:hypothetical protein
MSEYVINVRNEKEPEKELDKLLIPHEIYNLTINKETKQIELYFIANPSLMFSFVGFNSKLKHADYLASERKCSCFYVVPWLTEYAFQNNLTKSILLFNQQVRFYRYMIKYWYPNTEISYMRYLSSIALGMIQNIYRFNYNLENNLAVDLCFTKLNYMKNFKNLQQVINYIYYLRTLKYL